MFWCGVLKMFSKTNQPESQNITYSKLPVKISLTKNPREGGKPTKEAKFKVFKLKKIKNTLKFTYIKRTRKGNNHPLHS